MRIVITLAFVKLLAEYVAAETTREPLKEEKSTFPIDNDEVTSTAFHVRPHFYHFWGNRYPGFRYGAIEVVRQGAPIEFARTGPVKRTQDQDTGNRHVAYRTPQSLTKIAKTVALGFDPHFNKDYFEPFERRPKPVTLIGIRKNGIFLRNNVNMSNSRSSEIAELQSPYNDVGNFWNEDFI